MSSGAGTVSYLKQPKQFPARIGNRAASAKDRFFPTVIFDVQRPDITNQSHFKLSSFCH